MSDREASSRRSAKFHVARVPPSRTTPTPSAIRHPNPLRSPTMPQWTNHAPDDADRHTATLMRVKPGRPIRGICASPHLLGCWTHWFGGRTIPCNPPDCPACAQSASRRWHAYIHLYSPTTHHSAILELTSLAARELEAYVEQHHTLRGALLDVQRSNHRPNSTIILTATPADLQRFNLPPPLDIPAALERMWEVNVKRAETLTSASAPAPCT